MNARLQTTQPPAFERDAEQSLDHIAVELPGATGEAGLGPCPAPASLQKADQPLPAKSPCCGCCGG